MKTKKKKIPFIPTECQLDFLSRARWFFDTRSFRVGGRSTVAAYMALRLAMEGKTVYLVDPSLVFSHGTYYHVHRHFAALVHRMARDHFPDVDFRFRISDNTLSVGD